MDGVGPQRHGGGGGESIQFIAVRRVFEHPMLLLNSYV